MVKVVLVMAMAILAAPAAAQTLRAWDTDNDGVIDEAEFRERVFQDGVFDRWDGDDDGLISRTEFVDGIYTLWDTDDDGTLSIGEWDAAVDLWFGEDAVELASEAWDEDGDGMISREELSSALAETDLFARLEDDNDADHLLSEEEFADGIFGIADADQDMFLGEEEDWFLVDLIELFNAPDEAAVLEGAELEPVAAEPAGVDPVAGDDEVMGEPVSGVIGREESFVGLPIPCGTGQAGDACADTASRLCTVLGLGDPIDFLEAGGDLYAIRCSDGL